VWAYVWVTRKMEDVFRYAKTGKKDKTVKKEQSHKILNDN
jgi:hypothetical protein